MSTKKAVIEVQSQGVQNGQGVSKLRPYNNINKELIVNRGYDGDATRIIEKYEEEDKITKEGDKCRKCNTPVVKKVPKKEFKEGQVVFL